jgi:serralysin
MATSISVSRTGIQDIDALLEGSAWNTGNITFSFPASASVYPGIDSSDPILASFQPLVSLLQDRVRLAFATISEYANLKFTEITETNTTHADIPFGMGDVGLAGFERSALSFFPDMSTDRDLWLQTGAVEWSNPDFEPSAYVALGSFAFFVLMHEIGHALGLQHPTGLLQPAHDGFDYSIMDYRAFPGQGLPFIIPPHRNFLRRQ